MSDHHLPPPAPPKLMRLDILVGGAVDESYTDVAFTTLVSPTTFRAETLDGKIRLFDMSGRDFVLTPQ